MGSNLEELEPFGCKPINPAKCRTCAMANGEPPWEDSPEKRYCVVYSRKSGNRKPSSVYHDGGDCEYYVKA